MSPGIFCRQGSDSRAAVRLFRRGTNASPHQTRSARSPGLQSRRAAATNLLLASTAKFVSERDLSEHLLSCGAIALMAEGRLLQRVGNAGG